jgi:hypothetical protein
VQFAFFSHERGTGSRGKCRGLRKNPTIPAIASPSSALNVPSQQPSNVEIVRVIVRELGTKPAALLPVAGELLFRPRFLRISLPCYDSAMGNQLVLFTIERLSYDQALHASSHACELLIAKEMVGAIGFEPPSSWSRTVRQIH